MKRSKITVFVLACVMILAGIQGYSFNMGEVGLIRAEASPSNPTALSIGPNQISFTGEEPEEVCTLTFATGTGETRMRYEISSSDPNTEIFYTCGNNSDYGIGTCRFNDVPGSVHTITVRRTSPSQNAITLTVRKMAPVESIIALNSPALVAGPDWFELQAREKVQIQIRYSDQTTETTMLNQIGDVAIDGLWYKDSARTEEIEDLQTYDGSVAYLKYQIGTEGSYLGSVIVKYDLVPYNASNYPMMYPNNARQRITGTDTSMFRMKIEKAGFYEFVGKYALCSGLGSRNGEVWGGYDGGAGLGLMYGYFTPGEYWIEARIREDCDGRFPNEAYIWFHQQAMLVSADIKITDSNNITWANWGEKIKKVFTYQDPETGAIKTYETPMDDWYPNENGYYFNSMSRVDMMGNDLFHLMLEESFGNHYSGVLNRSILHIEKDVTIKSVDISSDADASVGNETGNQMNQAMNQILDGSGCVVSDGTMDKIDEIRKKDEKSDGKETHFSANLEIRKENDAAKARPVQNQLRNDEQIDHILDVEIVVRGGTQELGNILEIDQPVEMGVTVSNYDPDKEYSVYCVHNGNVQKLNVTRVEQRGSDAILWFGSNCFSTFAVVEAVSTQPDPTTPKPTPSTPESTTPTSSTPGSTTAEPAPTATQELSQISVTTQPSTEAPVTEPITIQKTPASVKAKVKNNKVTVSWKKIKKSKKTKSLLGKIKRVQVQYSTDPEFKENVVTKSYKKNKTKVTMKLAGKTTYYIRTRYVGTDGVSAWSSVKRVTMK